MAYTCAPIVFVEFDSIVLVGLYLDAGRNITFYTPQLIFRAFLGIIESFERCGFCDLTQFNLSKSGMPGKPWDGGITSILQRRQGAKDQIEMIAMHCFHYISLTSNKLRHLFCTRFVEILDRCKGIALRYSPHWRSLDFYGIGKI